MLVMYNGQYQVQLWKTVVWEHSDHQFWTPYMWSMPLDRCSPAFSVRDKNFQKVTNWSALVPEISSVQRDLWPFRLLDVVWMQWNEWSGISLRVVKKPRYDIRLMTSHFFRNVSFPCQPCIMANTTMKMTKSNYVKIVVWDHSDHQFWTPYMWSMPLDRCSPAFSVREIFFRKSQIEALWCPKSVQSSEICDHLLYWM